MICSMHVDAGLIDMLCLWWRYESQYNPVRGYGSDCPSTRGYQASRQYDDYNSALETDMRGREARDIGFIVHGIAEPYRTALHLLARNRVTGSNVWRSARLPDDREECAAITSEALNIFAQLVR